MDRQLQGWVFGQFNKRVDAEWQRGGDRLVESNGVAQVPEPIFIDWYVLRDGTAERSAEAVDIRVQELRILQFALGNRAHLIAELMDQAGVCGI